MFYRISFLFSLHGEKWQKRIGVRANFPQNGWRLSRGRWFTRGPEDPSEGPHLLLTSSRTSSPGGVNHFTARMACTATLQHSVGLHGFTPRCFPNPIFFLSFSWACFCQTRLLFRWLERKRSARWNGATARTGLHAGLSLITKK